MVAAVQILQEIRKNYTVFEKDQILTNEQLNSVIDYLNDQVRLSRIHLLGVGIVSGLQVSLSQQRGVNIVTLSKGFGITTDGDLLYYDRDTVFDRFSVYDESKPVYKPFYNDIDDMLLVYELIPQGDSSDSQEIQSLSSFDRSSGQSLEEMVAVLLMESYIKDNDICTGTDCDNLGQDCINTSRLLLVGKKSLANLKQDLTTPADIFESLQGIPINRALISSSVNTASLANIYQSSCVALRATLKAQFSILSSQRSSFLVDIFPTDPAPTWNKRLGSIAINASTFGFQYYYDFLKDVAETYNQFRDLLFGDRTLCCPEVSLFSKHLLLGDLVPRPDAETENRTYFYPSPTISQTQDSLNHAKFLVRKLDKLVETFEIPTTSQEIRITPSMSEDHPLEQRAIPYYYKGNSIYQYWNHHLHQRRMDAWNYSYSSQQYRAQGSAADPLNSQIGKFSFFRIEGHIGKAVGDVIENLEQQIKNKNLPIALRSILIDSDHKKIFKKPGLGSAYNDLHRLHHILRQDAVNQLADIETFSTLFRDEVNNKTPDQNLRNIAGTQHNVVLSKVSSATNQLALGYTQYLASASWKNDLKDIFSAGSAFKYNLGSIVKTEFNTPFDSFIGSTHLQWLGWLDDVIQDKQDNEDRKLLFSQFFNQHPGMEHFGGVSRGGTFILVYGADKKVIADFMLPYYCEENIEVEPETPPALKPVGIRPTSPLLGISIMQPSLAINGIEELIDDRLGKFKGEVQKDFIDNYVRYTDSTVNYLTVASSAIKEEKRLDAVPVKSNNLILDAEVEGILAARGNLETWKASQGKLRRGADQELVTGRIRESQDLLAGKIANLVRYVAENKIDVSDGTESSKAIDALSSSLENLRATSAGNALIKSLDTIANRTEDQNLKILVNSMTNRLQGR